MGKLRAAAEAIQARGRPDKTRIGQLMAEYPDDADEILDLLTGEPKIGHQTVADTLNQVYDLGINGGDVTYWRRKNR